MRTTILIISVLLLEALTILTAMVSGSALDRWDQKKSEDNSKSVGYALIITLMIVFVKGAITINLAFN